MELAEDVKKDTFWKMESVINVKVLCKIAIHVKVKKFVKSVNKVMF